MQDLMLKAAAVAVMAACLGGLFMGLERENARLGAIEMCDPGWNAKGGRAGVYYGIQHKDVIEFYTPKPEGEGDEELTLEELIAFCQSIGFDPGN